MTPLDTRRLLSDRNRLVLVALGALALCGAYVWRDAFSADFWEHAAVVRELADRPLAPQHPVLALDAPHAYASPYLLAVALVARATNIPAVTALALAGLLNLGLLVFAFRRFLIGLLPNGRAAAPYALLLVAFLWGKRPWMWSGFFHASMLAYDISYPSTFAAAAMFLALSLLVDALDEGRARPYLGIAPLLALCLVTHPPTALVLLASLAALFLARVRGRAGPQAALVTGSVGAAAVASLAWPYFPVVDLFTAQPREFHWWSGVFYDEVGRVVRRTWPILLATPVLLWRLRSNRRDPLVLMAAVLAGIYGTGGITGAYGLGRSIAYIAMLVQIALAAALATLELRLTARRRWLVPAATLVVLGGFFVYGRQPLPRLVTYHPPPWRDVAAILTPVRPGEVVLTDSIAGAFVPAVTGARVVAWRPPLYWVPDHEERRAAQKRFFTPVSNEERRETLARYHVGWILLNRQTQLGPDQQADVLSLGCVAAQRDSLVLVDLRANLSCGTRDSRQQGLRAKMATGDE